MLMLLVVLLITIVLQLAYVVHRLSEIHKTLWAMFKYWDEQKEYWKQTLKGE